MFYSVKLIAWKTEGLRKRHSCNGHAKRYPCLETWLGDFMEPLWKEFAQKEDLTVRLRNILQDYAFGPQIFRELLQNADDAGASRFALYADNVYHEGYAEVPAVEASPEIQKGHRLLDARLASWQGPGIMAFNNALFSEDDFEGICRVGASIKQSDHTKIGRYGLGFNATYHLTDVVSFVSNNRLCIFDPHRAHLPSNLPGLQLVLTDESRKQFSAQLAPFNDVLAAECDQKTGRESVGPAAFGTLFRLPLRTEKLAANSSISQLSHHFRDVLSLLLDFLASAGEALRKERQMLKNLVDEKIEQDRRALRTGFAIAFSLHGAARPSDDRHNDSADPSITAWLVAARAEPAKEAFHKHRSNPHPSNVPAFRLGAVAIPLLPWFGRMAEPEEPEEPAQSDLPIDRPLNDFKGQAYCFLPLSLTTGLPVHISANFAVTANRRDLWRRSDDQESSESNLRASWNEALLEKTCPKVYADALELLAGGLLRGQCKLPFKAENFIPLQVPDIGRGLWSLWPSTAKGHFSEIPRHVSQELVARDAAVFYTGDLVDSADGTSSLEVVPLFRNAKSSLLCSSRSFDMLKPELRSSISRLCLAGRKRSPVQVPRGICEILSEAKGTTWLEPLSLANMLRGFNTKAMPLQEADALVDYILSPEGKGSLSLLHGLALCPLLSGSLGTFHRAGESDEFLWAEDAAFKDLFPDRDFVDPASGTFRLLKPRIVNSSNSNLNIQILGPKALPEVLGNIFPPFWRCKSEVTLVDGKVLIDGQPQEELQKTYAQMKEQSDKPMKGYPKGAKSCPGSRPSPKVSISGKKNKPSKKFGKQTWDFDSGQEDAYSDDDWTESEEAQPGKPDTPDKSDTKTRPTQPVATFCVKVSTAAEMNVTAHRCELLWKFVEGLPDKSNAVQQLQDLPCIPVLSSAQVRLMSCQGAHRQHLLSLEDYTAEEAKLLSCLGCFFARPTKKLRTFLGIERASALNALPKAVERMEPSSDSVTPNSMPGMRMFLGMKDLRLDIERARPLQRLVCSILRSAVKKKDVEKAQSLPVFETRGGKFAVPVSPGASIVAPNEEWDELLHEEFKDFLLNLDADGDGGHLIRELGIQRSNLSEFLARFCAPRAGLFNQKLSLYFLESVASLGSTIWRKNVQKDYVAIATSCEEAPMVVFNDGRRCRCSELVDPEDVQVTIAMHPPKEYCSPVVLSVLRRAGLKSLTDEEVFLSAARHVEASSEAAKVLKGEELLKQLAERFHSLKWSSRSFAALSRLRIFPAIAPVAPVRSNAYPPRCASVERVAVSLDTPCTLFQNASVAWTQLALLHPDTFDKWPKPLLQRFSAIKDDPLSLDVIVANLIEAARRWAEIRGELAEDAEVASKSSKEHRQHRQEIVVCHLAALNAVRRSNAQQSMVQHSLCRVKFLVPLVQFGRDEILKLRSSLTTAGEFQNREVVLELDLNLDLLFSSDVPVMAP
eukprot:s10_g34.t1